jgi:hypothetical protein
MNKLVDGAIDALQQYREMDQRRRSLPAKRWPPLRTEGCVSVWSPRMTEQQQQEHEQYVNDHNLPF